MSDAQEEVERRRQLIQQIASQLPVAPMEPDCRFVETAWLNEWVNARPDKARPIDNASLYCEHYSLNPASWCDMKRVSVSGWHALRTAARGGPELTLQQLCESCTRQQLGDIVARCAALEPHGPCDSLATPML